MVVFLRSLRQVVLEQILRTRQSRAKNQTLKTFLSVGLTYMNVSDETKEKEVGFTSHTQRILQSSDVGKEVDEMLQYIDNRNIDWIRQGSGSVIKSINSADLHIGVYNALRGASYVELPKIIMLKKAVVNVKNTDQRCFGYSILACKYEQQAYPKWRNEPEQYNKYFEREQLDQLNYPVAIEDLRGIEERLQLSINVLSFYDDKGAGMYPVYHSSRDPDNAINLLYWRGHYAWIKDVSRLLSSMRKHEHKLYFCMRCLGHFSSQQVLDKHKSICCGGMCNQVFTMPPEGSVLKFKNVRYQQTCPFVIYADFESLTTDPNAPLTPLRTAAEAGAAAAAAARRVDMNENNNLLGWHFDGLGPSASQNEVQHDQDDDEESVSVSNATNETLLDSELLELDNDDDDIDGDVDHRVRNLNAPPAQAYQRHVLCSGGLVLVSTIPGMRAPYTVFFGEDAMVNFLTSLVRIEEECMRVLLDPARMIMTLADEVRHEEATECYVCGKPFEEGETKVRDHDHVTGRYRGPAHNKCNLLLRQQYKIPVFIHNFRGYDSHFIVNALGAFKDRALSIIGQGMEKYMTMCFGKHLQFKDSLQFLPESLESLVSSLHRGGLHKFENLREAFGGVRADDVERMLRKGVYPYDYMNKWERFFETRLPPIEEFASRLRGGEACSREDYWHAQQMWDLHECRNMKDYHDLYLKMDVTLLADVFENFRKVCMENYHLDPAHYISAPQLSWDAMLKVTGCELELISDPEMYRVLKEALRGGVAMISKRYARANNAGLGAERHDPDAPEKHIMYWDANNLYGWAMSQPLPVRGFRWLERAEIDAIDWLTLKRDDPIGYFIECDLEYPEELHDEHNAYPLAAERMVVDMPTLSTKQHTMHDAYDFNRAKLNTKLIPNLKAKEKYTLHYRLLKYYIEHGLRLVRVHRVIAFEQSEFMEQYIRMNQDLRAASTEDFEKRFYKGMNNSCFGKTCENMSKRTDIRLVNDEEKAKELLAKPHMLGFAIFNKDLAAVNLMKLKCKIDKPFYVGFAVLELSKLHMYKFHYDFVKRVWPGKQSELLFTDTDSLMYEITAPRVYETIWENRDKFDLSDYPRDSPYYDPTNAKVIGKFKDEAGGKSIIEFVGLRPKMYSFTVADGAGAAPVEKIRAKGIQRAACKELRHADYLRQLHEPRENMLVNRRIGSRLHRVYTYEFNKRGLCAFDDKRYICENGIDTFAHGHKSLVAAAAAEDGAGAGAGAEAIRAPCTRAEGDYVTFAEAMREPSLRPDPEPESVGGLDPEQAFGELRRQRLADMFGGGGGGGGEEDEEDQVPVGDMLGLLSFVF